MGGVIRVMIYMLCPRKGGIPVDFNCQYTQCRKRYLHPRYACVNTVALLNTDRYYQTVPINTNCRSKMFAVLNYIIFVLKIIVDASAVSVSRSDLCMKLY